MTKKTWEEMSKRDKAATMDSLKALYGSQPYTPSLHIKIVKKPPTGPVIASERQEQTALVTWAKKLGLPLIAIRNEGKCSPQEGARRKAMGLTAGVSDLFLAKPAGPYSGMWIEMKRKGGKPTSEQVQWINRMRAEGYAADWFDCWEAARVAIQSYLKN